ncbi:hypothetical protein LDENG_00279140 [Lucifuga dentata]|nr:hypothetical protein LDENG_00279140 [Lucifuga dentata]
MQGPKFEENKPVNTYDNITVCSNQFKSDNYEVDDSEFLKTDSSEISRFGSISSVFRGKEPEEGSTSGPAAKRRRTQLVSGIPSTSSQSLPPAELDGNYCTVVTANHLDESFHSETQFSSPTTSKLDENTKEDWSPSKTIVYDRCLMELFKMCHTCGQPITEKKVFHSGAHMMVHWRCHGGHRDTWISSPHLGEALPEINVLIALSILCSGGTITAFVEWAKHLNLNFLEHNTFSEIQKAYLSTATEKLYRSEQDKIFAKRICQELEGIPAPISGLLKKIMATSRRKGSGATSLSIFTVFCHSAGLEIRSDLGSDRENVAEKSASPPGEDGSSHEEFYLPQSNVSEAVLAYRKRSPVCELLMECVEEELDPWQKQVPEAHLMDADDQKDSMPNVAPLQRKSEETETQAPAPQPAVGSSQVMVPLSTAEDSVNTAPPSVTKESIIFDSQDFITGTDDSQVTLSRM